MTRLPPVCYCLPFAIWPAQVLGQSPPANSASRYVPPASNVRNAAPANPPAGSATGGRAVQQAQAVGAVGGQIPATAPQPGNQFQPSATPRGNLDVGPAPAAAPPAPQEPEW